MKALTKEDLIAVIEADPSLRDVLKRYDIHAAPFLLYASPRLQPYGQSWASHAALMKSDENILYPFQVVACHQNLGGSAGFNSFDYWSVGFPSLEQAAQAFCDVHNMSTAYLDEVRYDPHENRFVHVPNQGRIEFELCLPLALIA
ncbi:hypothetical protein [Pseudomonas amygdali]|uniref:Uncharacterized protein n=2 Tax=Pseudomonas amygdali pv. lachrymans TaxID=53707 RepID=A0ABR5KRK2_PSEAV|nr:hypothetical protein [Pseudomonas amygdali]AXH60016.1 hypothetical protein PLA107_032845 [Pseudomonas amygdali pv. lachrymans str. M301315]KPC17420.1 Uncharacterized protein AC499_0622 [Pseudomonas amygdali pv. lachrymans]RMT05848.1 hypothetical protein ALP54_03870 [Pseudomonas amygdali pv. lachrymans]